MILLENVIKGRRLCKSLSFTSTYQLSLPRAKNYRLELISSYWPYLRLAHRPRPASSGLWALFLHTSLSPLDDLTQQPLNARKIKTKINRQKWVRRINGFISFACGKGSFRTAKNGTLFLDSTKVCLFEGRATWCLRREDLCFNDDVIFFAAKKMTSSLLHKSSRRRHHVARPS